MGPYVKVEIHTLDPNGEVPQWELAVNRVNPFEGRDKGNKRPAEDSPENQNQRKKNREVPEWKVGEFIWMYLEGTKTKPDYEIDDTNLEDLVEDENLEMGEAADSHAETVDNSLDI